MNKYKKFSDSLIEELKKFKTTKKERVSEAIIILKEGDEDARRMAAGVLGEIGETEAIDALISALNIETSPEVKQVIINALSAYVDEDKVRIAINNV